jgi:hypothetical protein
MKSKIAKSLITVALIILTGWLLRYSWLQQHISYEDYTYTVDEAKRLQYFPKALYAHGLQAWFGNDADGAAGFFRQAVSQDVFLMDAWLKLAEAEALMGNPEKAQAILTFTDSRTTRILRWKWPQTLLAHELGMDDIFSGNINYFIAHGKMLQDAFQLLDTHFRGKITAALQALHHDNLAPYLKWLMRWGRTDNAHTVWQRIVETGNPDPQITLQYVHFLISKRRVKEARAIWLPYADKGGMTNAGFENGITQRGFDWRYGSDSNGRWEIKRVGSPAWEGSYALQVFFAGRENLSFHNLYQIVPVEPLKPYRLTYWWRSEKVTTDQGPFVDIYGYDSRGLYKKGPMITGTNDWCAEAVEFTPPENCQAVVVRLRRLPSGRFDSNIAGTLWLDNFRLEEKQVERSD